MSALPEIEGADAETLELAFDAAPPEEYADSPEFWFDEVAVALRELDVERARRFMRKRLDGDDPDRRAAALFALSFDGADRRDVMLLRTSLSDRDAGVRARAIRGLGRFLDHTVSEQVLSLASDPQPLVRAAVLVYASDTAPERARLLARAALADPDFIVREEGVDQLDELEDRSALPLLMPLLRDPHPDVRQAARTAIANLSEPL